MLNFCPQCGSKLQPGFKFCPSCGGRLPEDTSEPETLEPPEPFPEVSGVDATESTSHSALIRQPLRSARRKTFSSTTTLTDPIYKMSLTSRKRKSSPQVTREEVLKQTDLVIPSPPEKKSLISSRKGKASPKVKEEEAKQTSSVILQTPDKSLTSPRRRKASPLVKEEEPKQTPTVTLQSPTKCKGRKRVCTIEPVQESTVVCDQSGKKWKLVELLWQTELHLTYAVCQANQQAESNECKYILRLGAKEGHLFNEQNFHQRAAKPDAVEKWLKLNKMDFLGIPSCVGFGLHETYRFLVFPNMGQTLQSVMDEGSGPLSEKAVLQLALRILDSLEFIHEKEYAHADIHAGNIYINTDNHTEVFLSGFGHAFRFCPGGKHVEYREGSRTAHQGHINFISLDSHKGSGPSRRSDLVSLGYCMLFWMTGTLPWNHQTQTSSAIAAEKERYLSDIPGLLKSCYNKRKVSGPLLAYLSNVMTLQYPEKPDYSLLKACLHESLLKMGGTLKEPLDL